MTEVKTPSQKKEATLLERSRPPVPKGKGTNHLPNPDLFNREKLVSSGKKNLNIPADWRKFVIRSTPVTLFKGVGVTETEYNLIRNRGEDAVKYFLGEKALKSFLEENKSQGALSGKK